MTMVLHTEGDPLALAAAVRSELKQIAPLLPVTGMRTMDQVVANAASARRFNVALLGFFSISALLLTTMGIYGVVAFLVGRRRREIGIRMALGAQRRNVLRMVLRQGMRPVVAGSVAGLGGSLAASHLVANQLFGVSPTDPLTLATIVTLLLLAALMACWVPARRAAKLEPMVALRYE
jgi:putative ABC transport system permease protein